jgi:hypothetical protein
MSVPRPLSISPSARTFPPRRGIPCGRGRRLATFRSSSSSRSPPHTGSRNGGKAGERDCCVFWSADAAKLPPSCSASSIRAVGWSRTDSRCRCTAEAKSSSRQRLRRLRDLAQAPISSLDPGDFQRHEAPRRAARGCHVSGALEDAASLSQRASLALDFAQKGSSCEELRGDLS